MVVVRVVVSRRGARVLHVLHGGEDVHLAIARDGREAHGRKAFDGDQFERWG